MPYLYGEKVRLRAPEREDIPLFLKWINDPQVCEFLEHVTAFNKIMEEKWFEAKSNGPAIELPYVIEIHDPSSREEEWLPIGNIAFLNYHEFNRSAEIGIMIGEKACWDKGYGTDAMRRMCEYGFNTLNLHRIFLRVFEGNDRGKKAYQKVGFIYEGTMRQARYHNGQYWDVDFMSIIKPEWHQKS